MRALPCPSLISRKHDRWDTPTLFVLKVMGAELGVPAWRPAERTNQTVVAAIHASRAWQRPGPFPLFPSTTRSSPQCNLWCPSPVAFWQDARRPEPTRRPGVRHPSGSVDAPGGPSPTVSLGFGANPPGFRGAAGRWLAHPAHSRQWATNPSSKSSGSGTSYARRPSPSSGGGLRGKAHQLDWKGRALA